MLNFGAVKAVDFLPEASARAWLAETLSRFAPRIGRGPSSPSLLTAPLDPLPRDLDALFEALCGLQRTIGQDDVEFTLVEHEERPLPPAYRPLGNPQGQLLHSFVGPADYLIVAMPAVFRVPEILLASIARELGRIELHRARLLGPDLADAEAEAELAAVLLGFGVWVANGSYRFENKCCGGGCGVNLSALRVGLSLPEVCYSLALDAQHRGLARRMVLKHLDATQKAAAKQSWRVLSQSPSPLALSAASSASGVPMRTRMST